MKNVLTLGLLYGLLFLNFIFSLATPSNTQALGDWPMFRKDPIHSGFSSEESSLAPPLELIWKSEGAIGSPSSPAVSDGKVFIEFSGRLYAHDAKTGEVIWSVPTYISDHASVAVGHGMVFDGSGRHPSCENCGIVAYDIDTGEEVWRLDTVPPGYPDYPDNRLKGAHQPVLDNGILYFGSDDWYVRAVNALTGELLWTSPRLNEGVVAVPAVSNGKVFVGTWGGRLYALDASTGNVLWYFSPPRSGVLFPSQSISGNTIYFAAGLDEFHALDIPLKTLIWTSPRTDDAIGSSPSIAYGMAYFISGAGTIYAVDIDDGTFVWQYPASPPTNPSRSSPAVANSVVYVGSQDGSVYGFDALTGEVLWQYETDGPIQDSSPAIADGMLYIASGDGYLYAFGNPADESPSLDVPDIKQYSPPWGDEVYDSAGSWSDNPTIERWGCALTSMAMVLDYNGHLADPGTLNEWLNTQDDGYIRNGLINWLAVTRYALLNSSESSPSLEFNRQEYSEEFIKNEIDAERPSIVKIPGHFVTVKGYNEENILVNDPGSSLATLSEVETVKAESASASYHFTPSSTDLSYIMLVVENGVDFQVFGPSGEAIEGFSFLEEPIIENVEGVESSGEALKFFLYPKPGEGNYQVVLSGDYQNYLLDAYLYDQEGNVLSNSFSGYIGEGNNDEYLITIGDEASMEKEVTIDSIIDDLKIGKNHGLIHNTLYKTLLRYLNYAKRLINQGKVFRARFILNSVSSIIRFSTPRLMDRELSQVLRNDIQLLISSL